MSEIVYYPTDGPIEYTTVGGRIPGSNRQPQWQSTYTTQRRRAEVAAERRANPDHRLYGRIVPYNVRLPGGRDDWLWFDTDTLWQLDKRTVPLELEHGGRFLGVATVIEEPNGLAIDGTIFAPCRKAVGDRHQLSINIDSLDTTPRPDGSLHVLSARLREVSMVRSAAWRPHTDAVLYPAA